ncbi:MAG: hypothetical protein AAGC47_16155 [Bacteroidota bacterium]
MKQIRLFLLLPFLILLSPSTLAQLNTASPHYLGTVAALSSEKSPYTVTKEVAKGVETFDKGSNNNYMLVHSYGKDFALFENPKGKKDAFQVLVKKAEFELLCEHYVEENCDCFEGLHIYDSTLEKPLLVRRILTFSLKSNLVDEINLRTETEIVADDFNDVCEILEFLK